jgi:hypothetical protein
MILETNDNKIIKIFNLNEKIERLGGDGNWIRYVTGTLIKSPYSELKIGEIYTFMLENYTTVYIAIDKYDKIVLSI